MCGVAGEFAYRSAAAPICAARLERVSAAMKSRGPDGDGIWIHPRGRVGLAHRRLAILDLSGAGAQPMATPDGRTVISFNGEIYNFQTLRAELKQKGYRFRSESDTEVLLYLYQEHGPGMVRRLRGMFAFALWDGTRHGLLLARDPLGIKPLYYADDGACLRVASQVKALLAGGSVNTSLQPAGHVGFFLWGHVPEPWTLYKGICALPAGTTLWVQEGGRKGEPEKYFDITAEFAEIQRDAKVLTKEDAQEFFASALRDSVAKHMIADVPVGVFLSSGLDSSSVAVLAAEHTHAPLRTVTLGFAEYQGAPSDEVPLAEVLAQQFGFAQTSRRISRQEFIADRQRLLAAMDQPTVDGVNAYFVSKATRESGLKVALSGLGGDELLGGYNSFRQIPKIVRYTKSFSSMGRCFRWVSAPVLRHLTSPKYAGLLEYGGTYGGAYLLRRSLFAPWELPEVLDAGLAREGWRDLSILTRLKETTGAIESSHLRISALETVWYMRNQLLRDVDWASMAHSLEVRVPLVDVTLIREAAKLAVAGRPPGKSAMAHCAKRPLPAAILDRARTGFSVPVREWLQGGTGDRARGLRSWARFVYRGFVSE